MTLKKLQALQTRLLIPMSFLLFILIVASALVFYKSRLNIIKSSNLNFLKNTVNALPGELNHQAKMLAALQDVLLNNSNLPLLLKNKDRTLLLKNYQQLFNKLRDTYGVTHMYFHTPNRICLLRVHNPSRSGDLIDRHTIMEAEKSGHTSAGIELGPFGTFTLRVVRPVFYQGTLVGYLELGKEIEDILYEIKKMSDVQICAFINKKFLNKKDWQSGMNMLGRPSNWEKFPKSVIIYSSLNSFPKEWYPFVNNNDQLQKFARTQVKGKIWYSKSMPLVDASQRNVGRLLISRQISNISSNFQVILIFLISASIFLGLLLIILQLYFLRRFRQLGVNCEG